MGGSFEGFQHSIGKISVGFPEIYSKWFKDIYFLHLPFTTEDNTKNIKDLVINLSEENNRLRNKIDELSKEKKMVMQDFNDVVQS